MPVFANFYGTNIRKDIGTKKVLTNHDLNDVIWGIFHSTFEVPIPSEISNF